jgi:hypothetical protein
VNIIETIGAIAAGIITIAIVAIIVQPGSTAAALTTSAGSAFSSSIKAATLRG